MNIGIDIDGVLVDQRKFLIEKGTKFFKKEPINTNTLDLQKMFNCTKEEENKFWTRYLIEYATKGPIRDNASDVINKLRENNKIYIITSRVFSTKDNILGKLMRTAVTNHLKKNGIYFDEIIFCDEDKMDAIKRYNITTMIEDNVDNINKMKDVIDVIAFVDKHNCFEILHNLENIKTGNNWLTINEEIKNLEKFYNEPYNGVDLEERPYMKYYPKYQTLGSVIPEKMYDFVFAKNKYRMNATAINYYGAKMTFKELEEKIDECCKALANVLVKQGDVVSICMPNVPEAVIMFYALNKIGAVANMIHPLKSENEIKDYINETNSKLLLMFDGNYEKVKNIINDTSLENVVVCSAANSMPLGIKIPYMHTLKKDNLYYQEDVEPRFTNWNDFIKFGKDSVYWDSEYVDNKCSVLLHTGGSSGKSKTVMLSDNNFNSMVVQFSRNIDNFQVGDSLAAVMPIFHGFGLCSSVHLPLSYGVTVNLVPKFDAKNYHKYLSKYKTNHIIGVPTMMRAMKKNEKIKNMDLSFIKTFTAGGEGVEKEEELENRNFLKERNSKAEYSKGYGLTESVAGVTYAFGNANDLTSCGIPSVFTELKIFEVGTENVLPYNEVGEICICGPTNMLGYYNNLEATKKALKCHSDGKIWLHTNDLGYMTEDGQLYYSQRYDRMFITSGVNVYPQLVEKFVSTLPFVEKCCLVPLSHEYKGKVGKLYLTIKNNNENYSYDDLINIIKLECLRNLDKYHQPYEIEIMSVLPLTDVGKINYKLLETIANDNEQVKVLKKVK